MMVLGREHFEREIVFIAQGYGWSERLFTSSYFYGADIENTSLLFKRKKKVIYESAQSLFHNLEVSMYRRQAMVLKLISSQLFFLVCVI